MTSQDTEALKALVAKWRKQANALRTENPDFSDGLSASRDECANDLEAVLERMLASQTQDMVLVPREMLGKALTRLEYVANKIPENVPMTFHEEDCYYLATEIKMLLAEAAAPVASQMVEPVADEFEQRMAIADDFLEGLRSDQETHPLAAPAVGMDADSAAMEIWRATEGLSPQAIAAIIRKHIP